MMPADGWWLLVGPDVVKHEAITNRGSCDGDLPDCQCAAGGVGDCVQAGMLADVGAGGSCVGVQNAGV